LLPTQQNLYIRARGFYHTGYQNGSYSIVESVRNAYIAYNGVDFDFDGDKLSDVAIWNPNSHNWYTLQSTNSTTRVQLDWGNGSLSDIPVPADYDGDGCADIAVFRPSEGNWYILNSANNTVTVQNWGVSTDKLVAADYDGDGRADIAVWRPSEGNWYIIRSATGTTSVFYLGTSTDVPVPSTVVR
jgi:hypothetical protein